METVVTCSALWAGEARIFVFFKPHNFQPGEAYF